MRKWHPFEGIRSTGWLLEAVVQARLKTLGVDYVFANSGTDFPPITEGLAQAKLRGIDLPQAISVPQEHAAMGMTFRACLMTGRMQAVMLHTNVGLANGSIGAINAACENVLLFLMSGRTPVTEQGRFGAHRAHRLGAGNARPNGVSARVL
jgi:acetolactate synthase-1/2/3 large subunit